MLNYMNILYSIKFKNKNYKIKAFIVKNFIKMYLRFNKINFRMLLKYIIVNPEMKFIFII